ncbi:HFR057Cp [Eremothecium sinecaudum]|uniref:Cell division control protein 10 n=1 Tax=Eremothecium sinecaudum TaxID=45286 RepID=A0A0X8HUX2_9SACH|nr:HFR057Cp [Eremothecium sinecaudum]AMD21912.1 HFR057Cp [Eremothecium sinecaudum]
MSSIADTSNLITPSSYVGFDTITAQIEHRLLKRGFQFNIMVVGHSGLGKSTLINSLFASHLIDSSTGKDITKEPITKTTEIKVSYHSLVEDKVRLNVNCIDTPGFGDQINNDKVWEPIVKYIKEQHSQYLRKELTAQREKHIVDTRVHAVLYFIQPNGKGLTQLDIAALKRLTDITNVIPVIAKADTLTMDERSRFRDIIQQEFKKHNFRIYPYDSDDLTTEELELNDSIRSIIPFAVVGSEKEITINGDVVRGRKTRWGAINLEDINQCEFVYLREFLIRTHLQDLIESTALIHYESFRSKQLIALKENANSRVTGHSAQNSSTNMLR